jgi:hypothetical protein
MNRKTEPETPDILKDEIKWYEPRVPPQRGGEFTGRDYTFRKVMIGKGGIFRSNVPV